MSVTYIHTYVQCILSYLNLDYQSPSLSESQNYYYVSLELYAIHFLCISLNIYFLPKWVQISEDPLYISLHLSLTPAYTHFIFQFVAKIPTDSYFEINPTSIPVFIGSKSIIILFIYSFVGKQHHIDCDPSLNTVRHSSNELQQDVTYKIYDKYTVAR